jgi:hypothetical protein
LPPDKKILCLNNYRIGQTDVAEYKSFPFAAYKKASFDAERYA